MSTGQAVVIAQPPRSRRRVALAAGVGVVLTVVVLAVVNAIVASEETRPAAADIGSILRLPGGQLQVRIDGPAAAPAIVLIHRLAGSLHEWDPITGLLARDHRVIRVDLLGHGGSEKPGGGYSIENQARLLAAALSRLNVGNALVVGHSMGGAVAVALAEADPGAVARLVLIDSNARTRYFHLPLLAWIAPYPLLGQALWSLIPDAMVRSGLDVMFAPGFAVPDQAVRDLRRMTYTSYTESLREFERYLDARGLDQRLARLTLPRLVIWGERDQLVGAAALEAYRRIPHVEVVTMARSGHSPMIEEPQATAATILHFSATRRHSVAETLGARFVARHFRGRESLIRPDDSSRVNRVALK
jgi:pimeloyl-ACP methyl ester carboxylesterase